MRLVYLCGGLSFAALCNGAPPFIEVAFAETIRAANGVGTPFELSFWQSVDGSGEPAQYEEYLRQYPNGTFSALAQIKIASLYKNAAAASEPVVTRLMIAPEPSVAVPQPTDLAPAASSSPPADPAGRVTAAFPVPAASAPAPTPAPTPASAPASAPGGLAARAPVAAITATPAPVALAPQPAPHAATGKTSELDALLALLASSQESAPTGMSIKPALGIAMPLPPQLMTVPEFALPGAFCSAEARNAFYDQVYQAALSAAKSNNDAASGYLRQLQGIYDGYKLGQDTTAMNELAAQARAYRPEAAQAYAVQTALVARFSHLMAVPMQTCKAAK